MIIVWGTIVIRPEDLDAAITLSLEHVHRSRAEPGCIQHTVQRDVEDPNRLVFVEEWQDMAALQTHFQVPASGNFITEISKLADSAAEMRIFDATLAQ